MDTVLKFDRVVLVRELNDKFKKVGEVFEVANILDNSFLLRDAKTRVALGVVSFRDFEDCFVSEPNYTGWTPWVSFAGYDGQSDCMYRTNRKKVQIKFLTSKVRGEACRSKGDDFNLSFGIQLAYLRALNKALEQQKVKHEEELNWINRDIADNENILKKMINSLEV